MRETVALHRETTVGEIGRAADGIVASPHKDRPDHRQVRDAEIDEAVTLLAIDHTGQHMHIARFETFEDVGPLAVDDLNREIHFPSDGLNQIDGVTFDFAGFRLKRQRFSRPFERDAHRGALRRVSARRKCHAYNQQQSAKNSFPLGNRRSTQARFGNASQSQNRGH
jgi:hypothetical protein